MTTCPLCSSSSVNAFNVNGFANLWSNNLSSFSKFKFLYCEDCGFVWNADYGEFSFKPQSYDNFTPVSNSDLAEKLLAQRIFLSISALKKYSPSLNIIEVGSGKRLGMLKELSVLLPQAAIFAVDPILQEQHFYVSDDKYISLSLDLFNISIPPECFNVLVFRNSLEYFSPFDLKKIFNTFFQNGGLLVAELTLINISRQGYCHAFSECLNFYRPEHVSTILSWCNMKSISVESTLLHGADRVLSVINILSPAEAPNTLLFNSVFDLISSLEEHVVNSRTQTVMYAAGGRNIMGLLNHFKDRIDAIYDSDSHRKTSVLPFSLSFIERSCVKSSFNIVLLNSSFLTSARELFPENLLFVLIST